MYYLLAECTHLSIMLDRVTVVESAYIASPLVELMSATETYLQLEPPLRERLNWRLRGREAALLYATFLSHGINTILASGLWHFISRNTDMCLIN